MEARTESHKQALALARSTGDLSRQAFALSMLGWDQRDPDRGCAYWQEAIALLRQNGDWYDLARTLGILGFTVLSNGDVESAEKLLDEAYEVNQQSGDRRGSEFILTGKSQLSVLRGDYAQARAFLEQNCEMQQESGNRMGYLWGRARLAHVDLREGKVAEAHRTLTDVIRDFKTDHNKNGLAFALDNMALLRVATHNYLQAPPLIGWSDATRQEIGDPRQRLQQDELDQSIATLIKELDVAAYQEGYAFGSRMTLDEAVRYALQNHPY
jgi:tetratricopeptide (TPR) repeat protein